MVGQGHLTRQEATTDSLHGTQYDREYTLSDVESFSYIGRILQWSKSRGILEEVQAIIFIWGSDCCQVRCNRLAVSFLI